MEFWTETKVLLPSSNSHFRNDILQIKPIIPDYFNHFLSVLQLSESNSLSYGNNNNESSNSKSSSSTSRKVIITRKPSISDSKTEENNNNYTDLSDLKNNNNNSVTVYSENGSSSRCFEFQASVGPNGVCTMQPLGNNTKNFKRYMSPPPNPQFQQFPPGKKRNYQVTVFENHQKMSHFNCKKGKKVVIFLG